MMKNPSLLIACVMIGSSLLSGAVEKAPTIRISGDWVIVSRFDKSSDLGALPSTCAIGRARIMSVCIRTDFISLYPTDGSKPKKLDGASAEEIAALPAIIMITTTEIGTDGANKVYEVPGLTIGTAPEFLQKILEAAKKPDGSEDAK